MEFENFVKCPPDFSKLEVIQRVTVPCPSCGKNIQFIASPSMENRYARDDYYQHLVHNLERVCRELQEKLRATEATISYQQISLSIADKLLKDNGLL